MGNKKEIEECLHSASSNDLIKYRNNCTIYYNLLNTQHKVTFEHFPLLSESAPAEKLGLTNSFQFQDNSRLNSIKKNDIVSTSSIQKDPPTNYEVESEAKEKRTCNQNQNDRTNENTNLTAASDANVSDANPEKVFTYHIKSSSHNHCAKEEESSLDLFEIDFKILQDIVEYFEPFEAALADLTVKKVTDPTLGKFIPWVKTLKQFTRDSLTIKGNIAKEKQNQMSDMLLENNSESAITETNSIHTDSLLQDHSRRSLTLQYLGCSIMKDILLPHPAHFAATFLTPHFKSLSMLTEDEKNKTYELVKKLCMNQLTFHSGFFQAMDDVSDQAGSIRNSITENKNSFDSSLKSSVIISNVPREEQKIDKTLDKNPTLKALLETDTVSQPLIETEKEEKSHYRTLVSLLEGNQIQNHNAASPTASRKRRLSLDECLEVTSKQKVSSSELSSSTSLVEGVADGLDETEKRSRKASRFTSIAHFMQSNTEEAQNLPIDLEIHT